MVVIVMAWSEQGLIPGGGEGSKYSQNISQARPHIPQLEGGGTDHDHHDLRQAVPPPPRPLGLLPSGPLPPGPARSLAWCPSCSLAWVLHSTVRWDGANEQPQSRVGSRVGARWGQLEGGFPAKRQDVRPGSLEMGPLAQALISLDGQAACEVTEPQSQTGLSDGSKSFTSWGEEKPSLRSCSESGQQDSRRMGSSSGDEDGAQPGEGA